MGRITLAMGLRPRARFAREELRYYGVNFAPGLSLLPIPWTEKWQEDERVWEQGLMISNVFLEMTSIAQIYWHPYKKPVAYKKNNLNWK